MLQRPRCITGDCSAHDCEFVALAQQIGVKLVTIDTKVLKAFPKHAMALAVRGVR